MNVITKKRSPFILFNYAFFIVLSFLMLYPFWHVLISSFMTSAEYNSKQFFFYVDNPTLESYRFMINGHHIMTYIQNSVKITLIGIGSSLFLTSLAAYSLSKKIPGGKVMLMIVTATMFINPGLIPAYINFKNLGLIDTHAVLILNLLVNPFYLILMRGQFLQFPQELIDSAHMDGCDEMRLLFRIVLPLSKAMLAAIGLFMAVYYWNIYLPSMFFIITQEKKTIQDYISQILTANQLAESQAMAHLSETPPLGETLKAAAIMLGTMPIICVYPFLQKHFMKGAMIGAIKG